MWSWRQNNATSHHKQCTTHAAEWFVASVLVLTVLFCKNIELQSVFESICVCLCVNQDGPMHNRCTETYNSAWGSGHPPLTIPRTDHVYSPSHEKLNLLTSPPLGKFPPKQKIPWTFLHEKFPPQKCQLSIKGRRLLVAVIIFILICIFISHVFICLVVHVC